MGFLPLSSMEAPVELYVTVASIISKQPVLAHDTVDLEKAMLATGAGTHCQYLRIKTC